MVDNEKLKRAYDEFTTVWRFYKKYSNVQLDDSYWEAVVDESGKIAKQFENDRLCKDLLLAALSELERKGKELRARREENNA